MCMDPATMMIASTAISALGSVQQGMTASASANAQAKVANYNARVAEANAKSARQAAKVESDTIRSQNKRQLASQRAAAAAGGSTMSGSTLGLIGDSAMQLEYDALLRKYQGETEATAYKNQANLDRYEADVARASGTQALVGGLLGAGSNILSGTTKYSQYSKTGMLS